MSMTQPEFARFVLRESESARSSLIQSRNNSPPLHSGVRYGAVS